MPRGRTMDIEAALKRIGELEAAQEPLEAERDRLKQHNERLLKSVAKANEKVEGLEAERDGLKGQLPGDGSLVLGKDDAKRWAALSDLEVDGARGDAAKIAERLTQAQADRQTALQAGNEKALSLLGLRPDVLELRKFDGAVFTASKDGDKVTASVKQGDKEVPYETWVTEQGLTDTLKNFAVAPLGVPVLGQVTGDKSGPVTVQQRTEQKATTGEYNL